MLNFKNFLSEAVEGSDIPGMPRTLHDFLMSLSGPIYGISQAKNMALDEEVVYEEVHKKVGPKTARVMAVNAAEIPEGTNLHKRIREEFRKTTEELNNETPEESRSKLKESKRIWNEFAVRRGYKKAPKLMGENGKTVKSGGQGVHTIGFSLAPHTSAGIKDFDVCPRASSECRKNCLGTEAGGNKQYPDQSLASKTTRSAFYVAHPGHTARLLDDETRKHSEAAIAKGLIPGVRPDMFSDGVGHNMHGIMKRHPETQYYNYTKVHARVGHPDLPENYHLTLSHTGTGHAESNDEHVVRALEKGHGVAMVYQRGKNVPKPTHVVDVQSGREYPIIDGEKDDNTFDRHAAAGLTEGKPFHGVVSGLPLKGVSNESAGHFANKVDPVTKKIYINHPK